MTSPEPPGTPSRPAVPAYGEYAPPGDPRFAPKEAPAAPVAAPVGDRPLRRRDAIASVSLLAVGFLSAVYTILSAFQLKPALEQLYVMYGGEGSYEPSGDLELARTVLVVSHVVLFAAAVLVTNSLIRARRVSFWAPLVFGAVAAVVFVITIMMVIASDTALMEAATRYATGS